MDVDKNIENILGINTTGKNKWKCQVRPVDFNTPVKDDVSVVKRGYFGKKFDIFSGESSFHGLKNIAGENKKNRRVAWIAILLIAFAGLVFQLNKSISTFLDYPSNTNLKFVTKPSIQFPSVTICNINMLKFDEVTPLMGGYTVFYDIGLSYLRTIMPEMGITAPANFNVSEFTETYPGDVNLREFIHFNRHKIKDMLKVCLINGVECGPENFTLQFTNYGACYLFTPSEDIYIKTTGQRYGLSMILNVEHDQYITAPRENVGVRVGIDCWHEAPDVEAAGVDVSTGMRASIGLRKQSLKLLPPPHGTCSAHGVRTLKYYESVFYTQSRCYLECETDYFMAVCGCRTFYTPGNDDQQFCSPQNLTKCYIPRYESFMGQREEICDCPEACYYESFLKSNSFSGFPSLGVPETFVVTNQLEYFAMALGFNVKLKIIPILEEIVGEALGLRAQLPGETFAELDMPNYAINLSTTIYSDKLFSKFQLIIHDSIYFISNQISDTIFYEIHSGDNITTMHSAFYNDTLHLSKEELSVQIGWMANTLTMSIQDLFPSDNFTEEDGYLFMDVLLRKIFEHEYPGIHYECFNLAHDIYTGSDLLLMTREFMLDNLARIDIYFETMKVEEIVVQKSYEFFSIVSDLGGALGLFFGASIVAFVEAIDFWIINGCFGSNKK